MEMMKNDKDFYTTVEKAFDEIDRAWKNHDGLVVIGSHTPTDVEKKIAAIKKARESGRPALGICFGMQLMAVEYARNVLGIKDSMSEEYEIIGTPVVTKLNKLHVGLDPVAGWWGTTHESHWHHYGFNTSFRKAFEESGWEISDTDGIVEIMRLRGHPFFVGVQFHPEYQSSAKDPHPLLANFVEACWRKK